MRRSSRWHLTNTGGARRWRRDVLPRSACAVVRACSETRRCRARAQQIHQRPRLVGQVHGLGLVVRAGGSAPAARQSSTSTLPPRASAPPPTVRALPPSRSSLETGRKPRSSYPSSRYPSCLVAPRLRPTPLRRKPIICRSWPHLPEVTNQVLFDLNRHWYVMQLCNAAM